MTQRFSAFFIVLVVALLLFSPFFLAPVQAAEFVGDEGRSGIVPCGQGTPGTDEFVECNVCHLTALAQDALNFIVYFSIFVATLLFVYAGFLYITAGGSTEQIGKATKIFTNVLIGLIIVLVAWLVIDIIMKEFFVDSSLDPGRGPWNEILCK